MSIFIIQNWNYIASIERHWTLRVFLGIYIYIYIYLTGLAELLKRVGGFGWFRYKNEWFRLVSGCSMFSMSS